MSEQTTRTRGELEQFIFETITQIAAGVTAAQDPVAALGGQLNPVSGRLPPLQNMGLMDVPGGKHGYLQSVEFDVAVTRSSGESGGAGGGIHVLGVSVGGKTESSDSHTHVSRIKFSVPIVLPGQVNAKTEDERRKAQDEQNAAYERAMRRHAASVI